MHVKVGIHNVNIIVGTDRPEHQSKNYFNDDTKVTCNLSMSDNVDK